MITKFRTAQIENTAIKIIKRYNEEELIYLKAMIDYELQTIQLLKKNIEKQLTKNNTEEKGD